MAAYEGYRRSPEEYDGTTLRDYAEEIMRTECDKYAALYGTDRVIWYTDEVEVGILKRTFQQPSTVTYSYQFNIHDKSSAQRYIYTIGPYGNEVYRYDETGKERAEPSEYHIVQLMQYLRTCDRIPEPQLNKKGRLIFEQLAANIAVADAIQNGQVDIATLATNIPESHAYYRQLNDSILTTVQHTVGEGEVQIPYTQNLQAIKQDLRARVESYNRSYARPQLPTKTRMTRSTGVFGDNYFRTQQISTLSLK